MGVDREERGPGRAAAGAEEVVAGEVGSEQEMSNFYHSHLPGTCTYAYKLRLFGPMESTLTIEILFLVVLMTTFRNLA